MELKPVSPEERQRLQRLQNYKQIMAEKANQMGIGAKLRMCKTLTEARKLMRGELN